MSFIEDSIEATSALLAAGLRLFADLLDGPEPCGHELTVRGDRCSDFPCSPGCESWGCEAEPSRAEGTQHADAPGEVSRGPLAAEPSPGEPQPLFATSADSDLLAAAAVTLRYFVTVTGGSMPNMERLIAELTDRAAQFEAAESNANLPVSQEDLSAHIYAIANMCIIRRNDRVPRMADVCDEVAADLLSDYHITK